MALYSVSGKVGPRTFKIGLLEKGVVKKWADPTVAETGNTFKVRANGYVTLNDNPDVTVSSFDRNLKPRKTSSVNFVQSGMGIVANSYDLAQTYMTGTVEASTRIARLHIYVDGVELTRAGPTTSHTWRANLGNRIPSKESIVTIVPEDQNGFLWDKYSIQPILADTRFDVAWGAGNDVFFYGRKSLIGDVNSAYVGKVDIYVDGNLSRRATIAIGVNRFSIDMTTYIPSAKRKLTAKIYDREGVFQKEVPVPMLEKQPKE